MQPLKMVPLIVAVALLPSVLHAEPLWRDFDLGADADGVIKTFPQAKLDSYTSREGKQSYRVEGVPEPGMWAYLTFRNGLEEVKLFGRGADNYLRVVEGLRSKYGKPSTESSAANSKLTLWKRTTSTITARLEPSQHIAAGFVAQEPFTVTYERSSTATLENGL